MAKFLPRIKAKRSVFGTLQLACPLCGTKFSVRSTEIAEPHVSWEADTYVDGRLTFEINVQVEHVCPTGTVIEMEMPR